MLNWIDRVPLGTLVVMAAALGSAPFVPEPHLIEKVGMLVDGSLHRPIDIFDLVLHGSAPLLLLVRLIRMARKR